MQRILIIGMSGAGKSTFARALAVRTGLPLIHLDRQFWRPGWTVTPRPEWRQRVTELVAAERWIIEGNYGGTLDLRLPRADTVLWFDYPRWIAYPRIAKRVVIGYGRVRPDMAPGCPEQLDWEFLRWIWAFPRIERPAISVALARYGAHLAPVIFRRDDDWARFLDSLPEHSGIKP